MAAGFLAAVVCALLTDSAAASQVFVLDTLVTGQASTSPSQPALLTVQATTVGPNSVELNFLTNLGAREFVSNVFMNLDPALNPSAFSASHLAGATANRFVFNHDGAIFNGTGGQFDMRVGFQTRNGQRLGTPSGRFSNFSTSSYLLTYTGTGSFTAESFDFRSAHGPNHPEAHYYMGANINSGRPGIPSGRYVQAIPEPGTAVLLGGLAAGLAGFVGLRRGLGRRDSV
jgi:hypothetical protein